MSIQRLDLPEPPAKALTVQSLPAPVSGGPDDTGFMAQVLSSDDLRQSSVVAAPLQWIQRAFGMLDLVLELDEVRVDSHPILADLPGKRVLGAIADNYFRFGNSYLRLELLRDRSIDEMEFIDGSRMQFQWTASADWFYYWYIPGPNSRKRELLEDDSGPHVRHGINADCPPLGFSPLDGALAEIAVDLEAAGFTRAVLQEHGRHVGMAVWPDTQDSNVVLTDDALTKVKTDFDNTSSRAPSAAATVVLRGPTKVQQAQDRTSAARTSAPFAISARSA